MVPVKSEASGESGVLVMSKRKNANPTRYFHRLDPKLASWDERVQGWFVQDGAVPDMMGLIEESHTRLTEVTFCQECSSGAPCSAWKVEWPSDRDSEKEKDPPPQSTPAPQPDPFDWLSKFWAGGAPTAAAAAAAGPAQPRPNPQPASKTPGQILLEEGLRLFVRSQTRSTGIPLPLEDLLVSGGVRLAFRAAEILNRRIKFSFDAFTQRQSHQARTTGRVDEMSPAEAANLLGVKVQCSKEELQAAFKKALLVSHPDRGGSDAQMAFVNQARNVLWRHLGFKSGK